MPIKGCHQDGKPGYQWGNHGTCYTYTAGNDKSKKRARAKAGAQASAAYANGYKEKMAKAEVRKYSSKEQIVWGEVYVPDIPDSQGDFMEAEDIKKMAYDFVRSGRLGNIDVMHDNKIYGCQVVETFIARKDDPVFIEGSWVIGVHVPDAQLWEKVENGELNGFSMQAETYTDDGVELEMDIPEEVHGVTSFDAGHVHEFTVRFGPDGEFLGGETSVDDGHLHVIKRGTVTEPAGIGPHTHRFSFVEDLVHDDDEGQNPSTSS